MTPEDRLAAFLSQEDAPVHRVSVTTGVDAVFVAEVMQQVARRELGVRLASAAVTAFAAGAVLWACAPVLDLSVQILTPALTPIAGMLTLVAVASLLGGQMLVRR